MNYEKSIRALAALDLSTEQARLATIAQDVAATGQAYDAGQAKAAQLARDLSNVRDARRDGEREADALRAGIDIATIAKTPESIRGEREAVLAGMRTLNADLEQLGKDRQSVRDEVCSKLSAVFEADIAEMEEEARTLAARLALIFADAETIRAASNSLAAVNLITALRDVVDEAAVGHLLPRGQRVAASPKLVELLHQYRTAVTAAGGTVHAQHRTAHM